MYSWKITKRTHSINLSLFSALNLKCCNTRYFCLEIIILHSLKFLWKIFVIRDILNISGYSSLALRPWRVQRMDERRWLFDRGRGKNDLVWHFLAFIFSPSDTIALATSVDCQLSLLNDRHCQTECIKNHPSCLLAWHSALWGKN